MKDTDQKAHHLDTTGYIAMISKGTQCMVLLTSLRVETAEMTVLSHFLNRLVGQTS